MSLAPGARLGVYEITAPIGEGGMGQVYRATDTRLKRQVAIKILPPALAADADRLARFQREAEVLASLNHPNIGAIYGLEDSEAMTALVMELVDGDDLSQRIARGAIPLDEALPIARQIAEAIEAAHEQGIIHRDLKPANIKVREDGVVKVLDFGLAKLTQTAGSGSRRPGELSQSPTITSPALMTGLGVILGTAAYMAPEQAKGREADKRSDIWAFGCVLYEMLTGRQVFAGATLSDTLAAVLKDQPDLTRVPPRVQRLLHACLQKDPKQRLRAIGDSRLLLEDAAEAASETQSKVVWALIGAGFAVAALAALLAIGQLRMATQVGEPTRFAVAAPERSAFNLAVESPAPVISPDGRSLVFVANKPGGGAQMWIRPIDSLDAKPIAGTDGAALSLFWSTDSRTVGFFADGKLKTVDVVGRAVQVICDARATASSGGTWNADGVILFNPGASGGLYRVLASGGEPTPVTKIDPSRRENSHRHPFFLPDGRHFVYFAAPSSTVWLGSLDSPETTRLFASDTRAIYAAPGHLLFVRQGTLVAQPFDAQRLTLSGEAMPIAEKVIGNPATSTAAFSASRTGVLVYRSWGLVPVTQLAWVDRSGRSVTPIGQPGAYRNPELSPDAARVAVELVDATTVTSDIWLFEIGRGVASRFTFDSANDIYPVWSTDGARIAFGSDREGGQFSTYQKSSNGLGADEVLLKSADVETSPYASSADGALVVRHFTDGIYSLGLAFPARDGQLSVLERGGVNSNRVQGQVSRDGRWLAYSSNESGRYEIFVRSFPGAGSRWQVSRGGGVHPRWRGDAKELFYYALDGQLMAVSIKTGGALVEIGNATGLFTPHLLSGPQVFAGIRQQYDVAPDGQRFLLNMPTDAVPPLLVTVVVNWTTALLKK